MEIFSHTFEFKQPAGTSAGYLSNRNCHFIKVNWGGKIFFGEAAPLHWLSPDYHTSNHTLTQLIDSDFVIEAQKAFDGQKFDYSESLVVFSEFIKRYIPKSESAAFFALESVLLSAFGPQLTAPKPIAINGLIWMGTPTDVLNQAEKLIANNFTVIKLKINGKKIESDIEVLRAIRQTYGANLTIRLDANGSFEPDGAFKAFEEFDQLAIESVEQPFARNQQIAFAKLKEATGVKLGLDEELIGLTNESQKIDLIENYLPSEIIIKPSLMGGLASAAEWINIANKYGTAWRITSALESNIGLAQLYWFCNHFTPTSAQGLGTGSLFVKNIESPLRLTGPQMVFDSSAQWDYSILNQY